jgi:hypothetical protein
MSEEPSPGDTPTKKRRGWRKGLLGPGVGVLLCYVIWGVTSLAEWDAGQSAVALSTLAFWGFGVLAFVAGNSVSSSEAHDQARAAKHWIRILAFSAGLIPLYCLAFVAARGAMDTVMFVHSGFLRSLLALRSGEGQGPNAVSAILTVGAGGVFGDLAWYFLLYACGAWGASRGRGLGAWARGVALAACMVVSLSLIEYLGVDANNAEPLLPQLRAAGTLAEATRVFLKYSLFRSYYYSHYPTDPVTGWMVKWAALALTGKLVLAGLLCAVSMRIRRRAVAS